MSNSKSRVLLEKLIVIQLAKKFSAFYRTQRFLTEFIRTCKVFIQKKQKGQDVKIRCMKSA
jgi:hypothetical protein